MKEVLGVMLQCRQECELGTKEKGMYLVNDIQRHRSPDQFSSAASLVLSRKLRRRLCRLPASPCAHILKVACTALDAGCQQRPHGRGRRLLSCVARERAAAVIKHRGACHAACARAPLPACTVR